MAASTKLHGPAADARLDTLGSSPPARSPRHASTEAVAPAPTPGADKSARCLLVRDGRVLLVTHSNCSLPNRGKWALPGGRLEHGESPRRTLRRELHEELDLQIEELREIGRYVSRARWHRVYWAECAVGPASWDPAEIDEVRWFAPEDLVGLEAEDRLHYGFEAEVVADWRRMKVAEEASPSSKF